MTPTIFLSAVERRPAKRGTAYRYTIRPTKIEKFNIQIMPYMHVNGPSVQNTPDVHVSRGALSIADPSSS